MTEDQKTLYEIRLGADYPQPMIDLEESYDQIKRKG
jgi:deoxyribodipyrimidine photolyase